MSYNLTLAAVDQTVRLGYRCGAGTPAMQTAGFGLAFDPQRVEVTLQRRATDPDAASPWTVTEARVLGMAAGAGHRQVMRRFTAPFDRTPALSVAAAGRPGPVAVPPWLEALLTHAIRAAADGATMTIPAGADTVTA